MIKLTGTNPRGTFTIEVRGSVSISSDANLQPLCDAIGLGYGPELGDPEVWLGNELSRALGTEMVETHPPWPEIVERGALHRGGRTVGIIRKGSDQVFKPD